MIRKAIVTKRGLEKVQGLPFGTKLKLTKITGGNGNQNGELNDSISQLHAPFFIEDIEIQKEGVMSGGIHIIAELAQKLTGNTLTELGLLDSDGELIIYCVCEPVAIAPQTDLEIMLAVPFTANQVEFIVNTADAYVKRKELFKVLGGGVSNRKDALGYEHIMVRIPLFTNKQCNDALGTNWQPETDPHPAFLKPDGHIIPWFEVGMYLCSAIEQHIETVPNAIPLMTTLNSAREYGQACGTGWHVLTSAEYSAIALWCLMRDATKQPKGNTYYGMSFDAKWQNGLRADNKKPGETSSNSNPLTLTGSGPLEWRHNGDVTGIADLVGNELEWTDGIKLASHHNAIIVAQTNGAPEQDWITAAYFNAPEYNHGALSNRIPDIENLCNFHAAPWRSMQKDADYSPVQLLQQLLVEPTTGSSLANGGAYFIASSAQEHYAARGGAWWAVSNSGLACLRLQHSHTDNRVFRIAYYE